MIQVCAQRMKKHKKEKRPAGLVRFLLLPIILLVSSLLYANLRAMDSSIMQFKSIADVSSGEWQDLANKKIFFGHQSVGNNIIQGLLDLQKKYPNIQLNIVRTKNPARFSSPIFAHAAIGSNTDPYSKMQEFAELIHNGIGARADIVFFKFCFVDIGRTTDIRQLFAQYKATIAQIQRDYPHLLIAHCTVPLQVHRLNWKSYVKNLLHFTSWKYTDNIQRNAFNAMLLKEYGPTDRVFDLALFEATRPDGSLIQFKGPGGKEYLTLNPEYSSDGAHLNQSGAKFLAEHLLLFLLNTSDGL